MHDELDVERVPVGRFVDAAALPAARHEGDTLIVPVFEEVLVVEKRMRLVEEVRISKRQHARPANQNVVLRSEQVSIEHFDDQSDASRARTDSDPVQ
jgi:stress response protein YsnF